MNGHALWNVIPCISISTEDNREIRHEYRESKR